MSRHIFWTILKWYELKIISIGSHQIYSSLIELEIEGRWLNFMSFLCTFFFVCVMWKVYKDLFFVIWFFSASREIYKWHNFLLNIYTLIFIIILIIHFLEKASTRGLLLREKKETLKVQMTTFFCLRFHLLHFH